MRNRVLLSFRLQSSFVNHGYDDRLSAANPRTFLGFHRVYFNLHGVRRLHDVLSPGYLLQCAMSHKEELVRLERRLVFHNTVFWNANAVQYRAERAQPAHHNGAFP